MFGFTDPLLALDDFQMNSEQYGLMISDIRMPVINGYEFIKPLVKVFTSNPAVNIFSWMINNFFIFCA